MMTEKTNTAEKRGYPSRTPRGSSRPLKTALIMLALLATGLAIYLVLETPDKTNETRTQLYMPIVDPVLEPDRPDLIGDSLPDE